MGVILPTVLPSEDEQERGDSRSTVETHPSSFKVREFKREGAGLEVTEVWRGYLSPSSFSPISVAGLK